MGRVLRGRERCGRGRRRGRRRPHSKTHGQVVNMSRISDEQRRAAASKLRGIDAERIDRVYGGQATHAFLALGYIADAVGLRYTPYDFTAVELRDRLADLIEPGRGGITIESVPFGEFIEDLRKAAFGADGNGGE